MIHHNHDSERHESSEQMSSKTNSSMQCKINSIFVGQCDLLFYLSYLRYSLMAIELKLPAISPGRRPFGG